MKKNVLLINPYIEDFSAYDHFSKPLGLIWLSSYLKEHFDVSFINALYRLSKDEKVKFKPDGTGDFPKRKIPVPENLKDIPREFKRYGIKEESFIKKLKEVPKPDYIFITSGMTYWYTGLKYTVSILKDIYPHSKVILGGIYATILPQHAKENVKFDYIVSFQNIYKVLEELEKILNVNFSREFKFPDYEILGEYYYIPLLTSTGCVFNCSYCIGSKLNKFEQFVPENIASLIMVLHKKFNTKNFVFYDDALLVNANNHIIPLLRKIVEMEINVNFYTPNGLHIRYLTEEIAYLMKKSGFVDIRLSLESIDENFQVKSGNKTSKEDFIKAMEILYKAGFERKNIKVYTLLNVPEYENRNIERTMEFVFSNGGQPMLAFFSPIPNTKDFLKASRITDLSDPLFHNNTVYLYRSGFDLEYFQYLKSLEKKYRTLSI